MKLSKKYPAIKFVMNKRGYYHGKNYADLHTMIIKDLEEKFIDALSSGNCSYLSISKTFFWDSAKYWDTLGSLPLEPGCYFLMMKVPGGRLSYMVIIREYEIGKAVGVEIFKYAGGRVCGSLHYYSNQTVLNGALRGLSEEEIRNEVACCLAPISTFQYMPMEEIEKEDTTDKVRKMRCNYEKTNDTLLNVSFLTRAYFNETGKRLHKVRSFPRRQRVGVGRKEIKIVWVKEHTRGKTV